MTYLIIALVCSYLVGGFFWMGYSTPPGWSTTAKTTLTLVGAIVVAGYALTATAVVYGLIWAAQQVQL